MKANEAKHYREMKEFDERNRDKNEINHFPKPKSENEIWCEVRVKSRKPMYLILEIPEKKNAKKIEEESIIKIAQ